MVTTPEAATGSPRPLAARFLGQSVARKEDRRLLTGHGRYVDDVERPGTLHLAFVRSEVAKATIETIDTSAAAAVDGVVAVLTAADIASVWDRTWHPMMGEFLVLPAPLAVGDVRYVGDPVVSVVATSRYIAEDACELVEISYDVQTPAVDYRVAGDDADHLVTPGAPSNVLMGGAFQPITGG